jgi:PAS domain S-box-containing protein
VLLERIERESVRDRIEVLLISAHAELGLAIESMLDSAQYHVTTAASGRDALARVLKQEFTVMLLDVALPGRDGFETAKRLAQHEASRAIPIIFLASGEADAALLTRSYELGAADVLAGPLDPLLLRAKVAVLARLQLRIIAARNNERALREAERLRGERALRQRDAEYDATFENAHAALAHIGLDGYILRANARLCELLGRPREALAVRAFHELLHPDDTAKGKAVLERVRNGKVASERCELRCEHARGSIAVLDVTLSVMRDGTGGPKKVLLSAEDASGARRKALEQRALARASEILLQDEQDDTSLSRLARAAVPDLADYCIVELDASIDLPVRRFVAYHDGDQGRELEGLLECEPLRTFLRGGFAAHEGTALHARELSTSPGYVDLPLRVRKKMRALGIESVIAVPLFARTGHAGWMTWLGTRTRAHYTESDVPLAEELGRRVTLALRNACLRQDAERAERARDEFLSIASHELRTPLTPLQIQLQRLLGMRGQNSLASLPPEQLRSMLARAVLQVGRISSLVDNVLDVSRIKSGRLRLQAEDVDLTLVARKVITRFGNAFAAAGCVVSFDASQPVFVSCDKARVEQVLSNLIGNALKYGAGRPIAIGVDVSSTHAIVRVSDQGVGIAEDRLRAIFERFERASDHRTYGGLGLGLYVAHQIVDAHGGTITVQSEVGRGSTFTVELPRPADDAASPLRVPSVAPTHLPGTSRSILLVEDDPDIRECMCELLFSQGHRVDTAVNGWDALERLRRSPKPDLILLDLMMPVMDGFHFRSEQRKSRELSDIPVVVLSGDNNVRERARELQAQGFMTKPPNVEELLLVLDRIFNGATAAQRE